MREHSPEPLAARRGNNNRTSKDHLQSTKSAPSVSATAQVPAIQLSAPQSVPNYGSLQSAPSQAPGQRGFLPRAPSSAINSRAAEAPYEPFYQFSIQGLGIGLLLYIFCTLALFLGGDRVSTCDYSPYTRAQNPDALGQAVISVAMRQLIFFWGIRLVIVAYFAVLYKLSERKRALLIAFAALFVTYFIGVAIVELLKAYSGDTACHGKKNNGISGHFYYITWALFTVTYLGRVVRRLRSDAVTVLMETGATYFSILCLLLDGFYTYWYGYHSIKQIFYGAIFGALYTSAIIFGLEKLFLWDYHRLTDERIKAEVESKKGL